MLRSLTAVLVLAIVFWGSPASAFTTRVHIVLANDILEALRASGDGTIRLRWSTYSVRIPQADADAIVNQPTAFRAGAIGPDNTVFPAVTDGTHGVEQDPYRQCELLYTEAFTEAERAYALGCFLHGATDAVAHHFVNHFTGETFTLNPIVDSRADGYHNVIGHIVTESVIQGALYDADPAAFSAAELEHEIPQDFVLRTYFSVESPVWQRMALHPMERWEAAQAADPGGNLTSWAGAAGFSPWEQIAMAPQYVHELERLRTNLRAYMVDRIAELAVDPDIAASPGPDGMIGTVDDETACTTGCPEEFGEYWILVHLLAPRFDTRGNPLPSAFDKISTDLGANLYEFMPAFLQVIQNVSTELNAGITDDADHGLDFDRTRITALFAPVDDWAARTFSIDWTSAGMAVSPEWYNDLSAFLSMFSVRVTVPDILALLFQPIVDQIRDALIAQVRDEAEAFVDVLKAEYDAQLAPWTDTVTNGLDASAPPALGGHALDYAESSGLFAHAFNLTAASLANHEVLLVAADPIANGPTSFDASYTPEWTQIGLCDYLRDAVFPYGMGLRPLLSVEQGDTFYGGVMPGDSPVECHDGSLSSFGPPGTESCAHTDLPSLLVSPFGSLSRAYPPEHAIGGPGCRGLRVEGLPEPPPPPDGGWAMPGDDAGAVSGTDAGVDTVPPDMAGSCACGVAGANGEQPASLAWLLGALVTTVLVRRRRAHA
jgi:hypothetical protein